MNIVIAAVQLEITPSEPARNIQRMEKFVAKAARKKAQIVVFPEDAVTGPLAGQTAFVSEAPSYLARFQAMAKRYAVDIVPGTWTAQEGSALYNTAYYITKDGLVAGSYRKINLWETEKVSMTPGPGVAVFPTSHGLVGLTICWDISFPPLFAEMNEQGVQLVISPSYWSFTKKADDVDEVIDDEILLIDSLCVARAFENDIVFVYCNAAGELRAPGIDAVLSGRSQITHPSDKVLCKAVGNEEEMIVANVTLT